MILKKKSGRRTPLTNDYSDLTYSGELKIYLLFVMNLFLSQCVITCEWVKHKVEDRRRGLAKNNKQS